MVPSPTVPDVGRYVVTAGDALRVHDPATGRVVRTLQQTPDGAVDSDVELSRDGASVYALREFDGFASCGRTQVVSVATGGGPVRVLVEQPTRFLEFAVSPDRSTVARVTSSCTAAEPRELVLTPLAGGQERRVPLPDGDAQSGLAFAPDSRHVYVDGRVLDLSRPDEPGVVVDVPGRTVVDGQYRPDGRLVVTTAGASDPGAPLTLVALDDAGRPVGAPRPLPAQVGGVSYGPTGGELVGLRFPTEGDDYVGGEVVRLAGSTVTPLGGVEALAVDWT